MAIVLEGRNKDVIDQAGGDMYMETLISQAQSGIQFKVEQQMCQVYPFM